MELMTERSRDLVTTCGQEAHQEGLHEGLDISVNSWPIGLIFNHGACGSITMVYTEAAVSGDADA